MDRLNRRRSHPTPSVGSAQDPATGRPRPHEHEHPPGRTSRSRRAPDSVEHPGPGHRLVDPPTRGSPARRPHNGGRATPFAPRRPATSHRTLPQHRCHRRARSHDRAARSEPTDRRRSLIAACRRRRSHLGYHDHRAICRPYADGSPGVNRAAHDPCVPGDVERRNSEPQPEGSDLDPNRPPTAPDGGLSASTVRHAHRVFAEAILASASSGTGILSSRPHYAGPVQAVEQQQGCRREVPDGRGWC